MSDEGNWEAWITREVSSNRKKNKLKDHSKYDMLVELAISSYDLNLKNRKAGLKDRLQCFCLWWHKNRRFMKAFDTYEALAEVLMLHHSSIVHHVKHRIPTSNYEENTRCINDFLNS